METREQALRRIMSGYGFTNVKLTHFVLDAETDTKFFTYDAFHSGTKVTLELQVDEEEGVEVFVKNRGASDDEYVEVMEGYEPK